VRITRFAAVLAVAVLLTGTCTNKNKDTDVTPRPTVTPFVENVADFQVVGKIEHAFAGQEPPIDIFNASEPDTNEPDTNGPTLEPSPVGDSPSVPGVLRMNIEDASSGVADECGLAAGADVVLYWTVNTLFDPPDVLDDIENEVEGRVAGASGRVYRVESDGSLVAPEPTDEPTASDEQGLADESPFSIGSPDAGTVPDATSDCVLVADQVGFTSDSTSGLSTSPPRPAVRRTAAPTSKPEKTEEPSDEPKETKKPSKTPLRTATPTAQQR
jgi:hypothetical protein